MTLDLGPEKQPDGRSEQEGYLLIFFMVEQWEDFTDCCERCQEILFYFRPEHYQQLLGNRDDSGQVIESRSYS